MDKWLKALRNLNIAFGRFVIPLFLAVFLAHAYQWLSFFLLHESRYLTGKVILYGLGYDLVFASQFALIILPIFIVLRLISIPLARWVFGLVLILVFISGFLLSEYYLSTFHFLDHSIFKLKLGDIMSVAGTEEAKLNFWRISFLLFSSFLFLWLYRGLKKRPKAWLESWPWLVLGLIAWISFQNFLIPTNKFKVYKHYQLAKNPISYFLAKTQDYLLSPNQLLPEDLEKARERYADLKGLSKVDTEEPLSRSLSADCALCPYFEMKDSLPNLVYIFMEGMSRSLSGPNAFHGSFTPFLDSLATHSIEFTNMLSNASRTFGIFPNVLGALPPGPDQPFIHQDNLPRHKLISAYLPHQSRRFFYGGYIEFDNMGEFFKRNQFDIAISYGKQQEQTAWGLPDSVLYNKFLSMVDLQRPSLDVILTLSLHQPYDFPDFDSYAMQMEKHLIRIGKTLSPEIRVNYRKLFTAAFYTDRQLEKLFMELSNKPGFDNTIFVLVGDHSVTGLPANNIMGDYHIRSLIYSPLLKEPKRISTVNTHRQLAPAMYKLFAFNGFADSLEESYFLEEDVQLQDSLGLSGFKLISNENGEVYGFIKGDTLYYRSSVFKLDKGLKTRIIADKSVNQRFQEDLRLMRILARYVNQEDKILPLGR